MHAERRATGRGGGRRREGERASERAGRLSGGEWAVGRGRGKLDEATALGRRGQAECHVRRESGAERAAQGTCSSIVRPAPKPSCIEGG